MAVFLVMRRFFLMPFCFFTGFAVLSPAFSQQAPASAPAAAGKGGRPPDAFVGRGTAQDYQKDNPLMRVDMTRVSNFQGKMFETKETKNKQFTQVKDQPIVINKMYTQTSSVDPTSRNNLQNKEANPLKTSDLTGKQSNMVDKRAKVGGEDVSLKMAKGYDAKPEDFKKAQGYNKMLGDGQERYTGPGSPQNATEVEMIKEHLKQANSPEELKKNQLTAQEVQKLLEPRQATTRAVIQ